MLKVSSIKDFDSSGAQVYKWGLVYTYEKYTSREINECSLYHAAMYLRGHDSIAIGNKQFIIESNGKSIKATIYFLIESGLLVGYSLEGSEDQALISCGEDFVLSYTQEDLDISEYPFGKAS